MKDYSQIIQDIKDNITENGKGEITGRDLREILLEAIGNVSVDMEELDRRIEGILGGENYDDIINSWAELEQFLSGLDESSNLAELLSYKADKDQVYSKTDIDTKLEHYTKTEELGALALKDEVEMSDITNLQETLNEKLDKEGGEVETDLYVKGELSMGSLKLPYNNGRPSDYTLSIGELGAGADTPEGGGGGSYVRGAKVGGDEKPLDAQGWINLDAYPDVSGFATKEALNNKQDKIDDLETIRSGASLGATALQSIPSEYITETELTGKGYATAMSVSETYATKASLKEVSDDVTAIQQMLGGADSDDYVNSWQEITDFLDEYKSSTDLSTILSGMNNAIANKVDTETYNALASAVGGILTDYLSKANGGTIKGAVTIQAALKMNTLYLPNSNNTPSDYTLSVGSLGSGADTPEGGGGIAQVTINVNGSPYKTNADGIVTLPNYPTSLPASDVYDWAKAATKPTYTASEVGALSTSGGVLSGVLTLKGEQYTGNCGINASNSDIINLNAIYTSDLANGGNEGIQFVRSNGNYDSLWAADGVLYFSPNGNNSSHTGSYSTNHTIYHTGNFNPADYLPLSGGTMNGDIYLPYTKYIRVSSDYGGYAMLGHDSGGILVGIPTTPLLLRSNGTTTINGNTLIHSGNIGNQYVKGLATPVTIWGQSFDGSANVFGQLSMVQSKIFWHNDNNNYYIGCPTVTGGAYLEYKAYSGHRFLGGNVLIGTTTDNDSAKLQVKGNAFREMLSIKRGDGAYSAAIKFSNTQEELGLIAISGSGTPDFNYRIVPFWNFNGASKPFIFGDSTLNAVIEQSSGEARYIAHRTDTGKRVWFGIGSGGVNRGFYDELTFNKWLVYTDDTLLYLNHNTKVNGNISASGYQLPTSAPSNPVSGGYYLYVGTLGAGATIS